MNYLCHYCSQFQTSLSKSTLFPSTREKLHFTSFGKHHCRNLFRRNSRLFSDQQYFIRLVLTTWKTERTDLRFYLSLEVFFFLENFNCITLNYKRFVCKNLITAKNGSYFSICTFTALQTGCVEYCVCHISKITLFTQMFLSLFLTEDKLQGFSA